jgi:AcrR family transcriptional regulator
MKLKAPRTRRTQAERRNQTNAAIMDAALKILVEDGYAGFSASGAAARARVSRGALEHYYPKKHDLIVAATKYAMDAAITHARSLARTASSSEDPIEKFLASSEDFFFRPVFMAMTEIIIAARSDRELATIVLPIIKKSRKVLDGMWTDTLAEAGHSRDRARQFVELSHYLLRGVFFVSTWLPHKVDRAAVIRAWRDLAPAALRLELYGRTNRKGSGHRIRLASV